MRDMGADGTSPSASSAANGVPPRTQELEDEGGGGEETTGLPRQRGGVADTMPEALQVRGKDVCSTSTRNPQLLGVEARSPATEGGADEDNDGGERDDVEEWWR